MKDKHLVIRIEQCLALARASNCVRAQYGALLLDAERNVVLMDGYNGGPRGGGELCGDKHCLRNGIDPDQIQVTGIGPWEVSHLEERDRSSSAEIILLWSDIATEEEALGIRDQLRDKYKPLASERVEVGCHHAEMNLICNAAASGVICAGAWLIVSGEPCMLCAKLIHHAGIVRVIVVADSYPGGNAGCIYLADHGVSLQKFTLKEVNKLARSLRNKP